MKITLQQMRYLLAIVNAGSVTDAARGLSVSQGTISEAVSQIESEVGFKLFERKRKPVILTEEGEDFVDYVRGVIKKMNALEARFGKADEKVNFAVSSLPFRFAINALGKVAGAQVGDSYEFSIDFAPFAKVVQDISSGTRDFGVLYLTADNEVPMQRVFQDTGLQFHHLFDARPHILVSPDHPLAQKTLVTFDDLKLYPKFLFSQYIYVSPPQPCEARIPILVERQGGQVQMNSLVSLSDFVSSFAAISGYMIWCDLVPEETNPEELRSVPIDTEERLSIGYVKPIDGELSSIERQYVDALMAYAE